MSTRAQEIGVKPKVLERRALKLLLKMDVMAGKIASIYGDIDEAVCSTVDNQLIPAITEMRTAVRSSTEWLSEEAGT